MKRLLCVLLVLCLTAALCGCTSGTKTGLLDHWNCAVPVAACFFYYDNTNTLQVEELPEYALYDLIDTLNVTDYRTHGFHVDYYWNGRFGLELTLEDGTYWFYDGTEMELRYRSILDDPDLECLLEDDFVEVLTPGFWDQMTEFFPSIEQASIYKSW